MPSSFRGPGSPVRGPGRLIHSQRPAFRPNLELLQDRSLLSTYFVANRNDAGPGSLRQAILDANDHPGVDTAGAPLGPILKPLAYRGGRTQTHALRNHSPAINAGDNSGAPPTDQRGHDRIRGGTIDIGAYESPFRSLQDDGEDDGGQAPALAGVGRTGLLGSESMLVAEPPRAPGHGGDLAPMPTRLDKRIGIQSVVGASGPSRAITQGAIAFVLRRAALQAVGEFDLRDGAFEDPTG